MIARKKIKGQEPQSLVKTKGRGVEETKEAKALFGKAKNKDQKFKFKAYKEPDVKDALEKIFKFKCAYCETRYTRASRVEVEHFRPKSAIDVESGKRIRPGYYWLAADWENLLPACTNCNQREKRKVFGITEKVHTGKGNLFPIEKGSKRARRPGAEKNEKALLINPCSEDPNDYLVFSEDGLVFPKGNKRSRSYLRGLVSIEVYGLLREELVEARAMVVKAVLRRLQNIKTFEDLCGKFPSNAHFENCLNAEINELRDILRDDGEYLGVLRQTVHRKNKKN